MALPMRQILLPRQRGSSSVSNAVPLKKSGEMDVKKPSVDASSSSRTGKPLYPIVVLYKVEVLFEMDRVKGPGTAPGTGAQISHFTCEYNG